MHAFKKYANVIVYHGHRRRRFETTMKKKTTNNPKCDTLLVEKPQKKVEHRFWWWLVTMNLWLSGMKPPLSLFLYSRIIICSHLFIFIVTIRMCAPVCACVCVFSNFMKFTRLGDRTRTHHVRIFAQGQTCAFAPTTMPPPAVATIFGNTFALRIASLSHLVL